MNRHHLSRVFACVSLSLFGLSFQAGAQSAGNQEPMVGAVRYTLILDDPPVSARFSSAEASEERSARDYGARIRQTQQTVRQRLESRGVRVLGSVDTLLNALFVAAPAERRAELAELPGVKGVVASRAVRPALNKATALVNAPAAWSVPGGKEGAGKGVKIGIVDTGIDQNHAAFRNSALPMPAGFPKCGQPSDCLNFTNNKVIVARSFVSFVAAGSDPANLAADSRPDDLSPRDRMGHGTAVASCAAGESVTGLVTFNGIAPAAWLGNYKVFGSPGLNESAPDQAVIAALEQAVKDRMDIVNLSLGDVAAVGPLDSGSVCGLPAGVACDPLSAAVESAVHQGVVVVVSAGNDNGSGTSYPTYNSIGTPGDTPSAITVGASSNSHVILATISVAGLTGITAVPGSTGLPLKTLTAPLVDVASVGNDGQACTALPAGSAYGGIALVKDSGCGHTIQAGNVIAAGGIGMILYAPGSGVSYAPTVFQIPAVQIPNADGMALKAHLAAHPGAVASISGSEQANTPDQMLHFSSIGPAAGDSAIKPDLVAPGGGTWGFNRLPGMYMASESYDPWSGEYNSDGFMAAQGTSFSAPIVAGAAALVKQAHPGFTPAQVKSALANTAAQTILTDDTPQSSHAPYAADAQWFGAGRLDVAAAIASTVTVAVTAGAQDTRYVSSISFGVADTKSLPLARQLTITNTGAAPVNLTLAVAASHGGLVPAVAPTTLAVAPGQSGTATVTLSGTLPSAGSYSGAVTIAGSGAPVRVPYLYLVSDGVAAALIDAMPSGVSSYPAGARQVLKAKILDGRGAPLAGVPVHWINDSAKGTLASDYSNTDKNGVAAMPVVIDRNTGDHPNWAAVGDRSLYLNLVVLAQPTIAAANGVLNAASFDPNQPVAPGSYVTIFGANFGSFAGPATTPLLPLAMGSTFVSFDVPAAGISVPGRLTYTGPGQINLQVPWELRGQTSAQVKVTYRSSYGKLVTVPLGDYSPAFFEIGSGMVAALDANYQLITSAHPVGRNQVAQLYANGLGPVTNQPPSGEPALGSPLSEIPASTPVTVTIGGKQAQVYFAGLAPGFPALYQVNVLVPGDLSPGNQPISVAVGGKTSKAVNIAVQ